MRAAHGPCPRPVASPSNCRRSACRVTTRNSPRGPPPRRERGGPELGGKLPGSDRADVLRLRRSAQGIPLDVALNLTSETVEQLDPARPLRVEPEAPLRDVLRQMKEHRSGHVLVCEAGRLVGIFTERDALRFMAEEGSLDEPVRQRMTPRPVTVRVGDRMADCIRRMARGGYRRLPIVDAEGVPVGLVKVSAIVHYLVSHFPRAVYNLPPQTEPILLEREGP